MRRRGAPPDDIGRAFVSGSGLLTRMGRLDDARAMLLECRVILEEADDTGILGMVLNALADVEDARDNASVAVDFLHDALRYSYAHGAIGPIALSHSKLGAILARTTQQTDAVAHSLAAALLYELMSAELGFVSQTLKAGEALRRHPSVTPPFDVAELCDRRGTSTGCELDRLLTRLDPKRERTDRTWKTVIARAHETAMVVTATLCPDRAASETPRTWHAII